MRVKIGTTWYEAAPEQPIMVELTDGDKQNIANMLQTATRYAIFDDASGMTPEQMRAWMDEGAEGRTDE